MTPEEAAMHEIPTYPDLSKPMPDQEPLTVTGYRRFGNKGVVHLFKHGFYKDEFVAGLYTVNDPRKEICGNCYNNKRYADRHDV